MAENVVKDLEEKTSLHCAVKRGDSEEVKRLLKDGRDPNIQDCDGNTPLHFAFPHCLGLVDTLVNYGANVNLQNSLSKTPLHIAMSCDPVKYSGLLYSVKILFEKGVKGPFYDTFYDVNIQDIFGKTPLHILVESNVGRKHLNDSLSQNELCTLLLDNGANVTLQDKNGETPLHIAVRSKFQFTGLILERVSGKSAVNIPNKLGEYPIHKAVHWNNFANKLPPSKYRAKRGSSQPVLRKPPIDHVELLIEMGSEINVGDREGRTPLHHLAKHYRCSSTVKLKRTFYNKVTMLLDWGASFDTTDNWGLLLFDRFTFNDLELKYEIRKACLYSPHNIMELISDWKYYWREHFEWESYKDACSKEVEKLKTERIGNYSLYEIFKQLSDPRFISNRELKDVIKSRELEAHFPIYNHLIKSTYKAASERVQLMDDAADVLHTPLPIEITRYILTLVDNKSLRNVIKAMNLVSQDMEY